MKALLPARLPALALGCYAAAFGLACAAFVRQPQLASFADDSVSYLIMAQVFSPWHAAAPAVMDAFRHEAFYPPLFPLLLAFANAANDVARAHAAEAVLLAVCVPLAYALGSRWLGSRWSAAACAVLATLLPATWINAKPILSEPLYCVGILSTLCVLEMRHARLRLVWLSLALASLALTRTAGIALVLGFAAWTLVRRGEPRRQRWPELLPPALALLAYAAWVLLRPATAVDPNIGLLGSRLGELNVLRQASAMGEAWAGSFILYWVQGRPMTGLLAAAVGALALAGLVLRLRDGKADGWMMGAYLATFLAWPFDEQMGRFLFPALPVLLLYAFLGAGKCAATLRRPPAAGHALIGLLIAAIALPPLAFIYKRWQTKAPEAVIIDWYRTPDLDLARRRAQTHLELLADMEAIEQRTEPAAKVAWVAPAYIALLADRFAVRSPPAGLAPAEYRAALVASGAQYVFVSAFHPRDTVSEAAWLTGVAALYGHAPLVSLRTESHGNRVTSMLFKAPGALSVAVRQ
ncbi:MAG TPA: hypothetical protein VI321_11265 [Burkholderiales bacterium]